MKLSLPKISLPKIGGGSGFLGMGFSADSFVNPMKGFGDFTDPTSILDPQKQGTGTVADLLIPTLNGNNPTTFLTDSAGLTNVGEQNKAYNGAKDTINGIIGQSDLVYGDILDRLVGNNDANKALAGGDSVVTDYNRLVDKFDPTRYGVDSDGYDVDSSKYGLDSSKYGVDSSALSGYKYGKDVSDFMSPAADYNISKSVEAAQNALAGQGGMSGGAAARQLQAVASEAASKEYDSAFERMMNDQQLDYSRVKDALGIDENNASRTLQADTTTASNLMGADVGNATRRLQADTTSASNLMGAEKTKLDAMGGLADRYFDVSQKGEEDIINALLSKLGSDSELKQALAQIDVDKASQGSPIANLLPNIFKSIMSFGG